MDRDDRDAAGAHSQLESDYAPPDSLAYQALYHKRMRTRVSFQFSVLSSDGRHRDTFRRLHSVFSILPVSRIRYMR